MAHRRLNRQPYDLSDVERLGMLMYHAVMRCVTNPLNPRRAVLLVLALLTTISAHADIARHKVRIEGHGQLTVVFEAGLGDTLDVWTPIQSLIAASCTRTISYTARAIPEVMPRADRGMQPRSSLSCVRS